MTQVPYVERMPPRIQREDLVSDGRSRLWMHEQIAQAISDNDLDSGKLS